MKKILEKTSKCPLCEQDIENDEMIQIVKKILIDSGLHNMASLRYKENELPSRLSFINNILRLNRLMD